MPRQRYPCIALQRATKSIKLENLRRRYGKHGDVGSISIRLTISLACQSRRVENPSSLNFSFCGSGGEASSFLCVKACMAGWRWKLLVWLWRWFTYFSFTLWFNSDTETWGARLIFCDRLLTSAFQYLLAHKFRRALHTSISLRRRLYVLSRN